ncbi:hypothetical protein [Duganella callida]|uniref:Uncharacterized protein n=1 Tax=Duganella callida TaxID=2561932 RepID=A0A4Y9S9P5_9BURK|nr:hypothetical protein [Duganella callida]TFW17251.1 hypothetical protein E4L98_21000 [Duganella callida]
MIKLPLSGILMFLKRQYYVHFTLVPTMTPTVYIYADGSDLHDVAEELLSGFGDLANSWFDRGAVLVNSAPGNTPAVEGEDFPDWFLGINIPLARFHDREVSELLPVLTTLTESTGREFVIGVADESGRTEDLVFFDERNGESARQELLQRVCGL